MDKKKIGLFILLLGVLVVVYFGYRSVSSGNKGEALISGDGAQKESATEAGQEILALLDDLKKIHLDDSLFADPAFLSLKDFTVEVKDQPKGRPNPFAPIGKDDFSNFHLGENQSQSGTSTSVSATNPAGMQTSVTPAPGTGAAETNTAPATTAQQPTGNAPTNPTNPSSDTSADSNNAFGTTGNSGPTLPPPSPAVPSM